MMSAECLTLREMHPQAFGPEHEPAGTPPLMPIAAGGFSDRPRCRIFPVGSLWVLQLEISAGWTLGNGPFDGPWRTTFRTLAAAVNHAVLRGYDYRIVRPAPVARLSRSVRLPSDVKDEAVEAKYDKDLLTVRVPKPAEMQRRVRRSAVKRA